MTGWAVPGFVHIREVRQDPVGRRVVARHPLTRRFVSVTYLSPEFLADTEFRERFPAESTQLARVRDARVERIRHYLEGSDGAAVVADYLPGTLLRALLHDEGAVATEAALVLFKDVLLGLAAGHAAGLVHGDVKPEAVLLTRAGRVQLVDFGLSTWAGRRMLAQSTPFYLAPEQWQGGPGTWSGDLYAATVTFFECLAGGPPFHADGPAALFALHQQGVPPLDAVPRSVRQLMVSGLAKDPTSRPTARQFLAQVEQVARYSFGPGWERRGRAEFARLLAGPARPSGAAVLAGVQSRPGGERRQPLRLAAVLGGSLLLAVGISSPLPVVWVPKIPDNVSGPEGGPPAQALPAPPGEVAGLQIAAAAPAADRGVPPHQPAAMVARAKAAAVAGAPAGASPAAVPSGDQTEADAVPCELQDLPAEPVDPQLTGTPRSTSASTADPDPELGGSAPEALGEPSTSPRTMSDPSSVETDEAAGPHPESSGTQDPAATWKERAEQELLAKQERVAEQERLVKQEWLVKQERVAEQEQQVAEQEQLAEQERVAEQEQLAEQERAAEQEQEQSVDGTPTRRAFPSLTDR